ncbi:MAG: type IV secretion system protein VirB10 [Bosea sp. (in: a-proteobacteria)]
MPTRDDYAKMEMEGLIAADVGRTGPRSGRFPVLLFGIAAVAILGWGIWRASGPGPRNMTQPDTEEFRTTQFPAPMIDTPIPPTRQDRLVIQPDPPPSPPPPIQVLPSPPPAAAQVPLFFPADDSEERRRREEEERRKWERLRSPMIVVDNATTGSAAPSDAFGPAGASLARPESESDPNRRFLASAASAGVEVSVATRNDRIDALIAQGTMIRGVLETAIQSDLPGQVRAVTTEDVWSFDGRRVLIPKGSRLIGDYRSGITRGQTRIFVVWTRMLRADGVSVQLGSFGTDDLGRSGLTGFVDNHYFERFGSAILLSVLGAGAAYALDNRSSGTTSSTDLPPELQRALADRDRESGRRRSAAETVSQTLTGIARDALQDSLSIAPTIHVDQGTRIMVFVRRDLDFSSLYSDPVHEALKELRKGGSNFGRTSQTDGVSRSGAQPAPSLVRKP